MHLQRDHVSPCTRFLLSHTHTNEHTQIYTYDGWWGLGEKRQSSVPWRRSSGSGQDSARCNPSQVMLFTFSRFQLICLNAPSSSPKKPPPPPQPAQPLRTRQRKERAQHCQSSDRFSAFPLSGQRRTHKKHKLPLFHRTKQVRMRGSHHLGLEWHRVRKPC